MNKPKNADIQHIETTWTRCFVDWTRFFVNASLQEFKSVYLGSGQTKHFEWSSYFQLFWLCWSVVILLLSFKNQQFTEGRRYLTIRRWHQSVVTEICPSMGSQKMPTGGDMHTESKEKNWSKRQEEADYRAGWWKAWAWEGRTLQEVQDHWSQAESEGKPVDDGHCPPWALQSALDRTCLCLLVVRSQHRAPAVTDISKPAPHIDHCCGCVEDKQPSSSTVEGEWKRPEAGQWCSSGEQDKE